MGSFGESFCREVDNFLFTFINSRRRVARFIMSPVKMDVLVMKYEVKTGPKL